MSDTQGGLHEPPESSANEQGGVEATPSRGTPATDPTEPIPATGGGERPAGSAISGATGPSRGALGEGSNEALMRDLRTSPWLLVPAVALIALTISWLASIVLTFGSLPAGSGGIRMRLLTLFDPASGSVVGALGRSGNLGWALALLVAFAIAAFGERPMAGPRLLWGWLRDGLVWASALLAATAFIQLIIDLTYLGAQPDAAIAALLSALAVLPVCGATVWWGVSLGTRDPTPYVRQLSSQVSGSLDVGKRVLRSRGRRAASRQPGPGGTGPEAGAPPADPSAEKRATQD